MVWTVAGLWLLGIIALQVVVGVSLSQVGQGLSLPALVVAAIGLGGCLTGGPVLAVISRRFGPGLHAPARVLAVSGIVLGGAGLVWIRHDLEKLALIAGGPLFFILLVSKGVRWSAEYWEGTRRGGRPGFWILLVPLSFAGSIVGAAAAPSGLGLRFQSYEAILNRLIPQALSATRSVPSGCVSGSDFPTVPGFGRLAQVCSRSGDVEFDATGSYVVGDYAYVYKPYSQLGGSGESCVLHLDGPWWEFAPGGGGVACPGGFTYIPGP